MDRNRATEITDEVGLVALRKESVDRNVIYLLTASAFLIVALRKESVDRNVRPPAGPHVAHKVALRKESVDRNKVTKTEFLGIWRRSPQGERG